MGPLIAAARGPSMVLIVHVHVGHRHGNHSLVMCFEKEADICDYQI